MIVPSLLVAATVSFLVLSVRATGRKRKGRKPIHVTFVLAGAFVGWLLWGSWHGAVIGGILGLVGSFVILRKFKLKLMEKRKRQLSESLLMLSNLLAAGFSMSQAMATVARETSAPLKQEWQRVMRHVELGAELPHALSLAARRLGEEDLTLAAIALGIQERKGGSIVRMLERIADTINQRNRLSGRVRILTAQGRMTAIIVMVLPFILILGQRALAPQLWQAFFQSAQGPKLLLCAAVLQVIGSWWVFKLSAPVA
jgi:tight adherence protein B